MLIGAEIYFDILKQGQIKLGKDLPIMQNSVLGWIIAGKIGNENLRKKGKIYTQSTFFTNNTPSTDELLAKFWELEDFPDKAVHTKEERECEQHFLQTVTRNDSGRYIVQLPYRSESSITLGDSYSLAHRRLYYLLKRLHHNQPLLQQYQEFLNQLTMLLVEEKFLLYKWCSNNNSILANVKPNIRQTESQLVIGKAAVKTLGLIWLPSEDQFKFVINTNKHRSPITKRTVLSDIASIFDPLGLLGLVIINAKILMQQLQKEKISWDEELSTNLQSTWKLFRNDLQELREFTVDRRVVSIKSKKVSIELHGFADTSQTAYGACVYLKSYRNLNEVSVHLIAAKSKVAPIKPTTIPRLELCAALTLSKLVNKLNTSLHLSNVKPYLWTDSMITLQWILSSPTRYKQFVGNRLTEIQDLTSNCVWRHVPTHDNPADYLSRGLSSIELKNNNMWWHGPKWLQSNEETWPMANIVVNNSTIEVKHKVFVTASSSTNLNLFEKFSTFSKLQRVVAYCRRFIHNVKLRDNKITAMLSVKELHESLTWLLQKAQSEVFEHDIQLLKDGQIITKGSLKCLTLFLDKNSLLRVGGRLHNSDTTFGKNIKLFCHETINLRS